MDELEVQQESRDIVGNLTFSPPPMKKSDTRDSISSVDSDVSLSFDRRGSKDEEADQSDSMTSDSEGKSTEAIVKQQNGEQDSGIDSLDDVAQKELGKQKTVTSSNKESTVQDQLDNFVLPSDELSEKICTQVESYFADENIVKDAFLLKHVKRNKEGYVSLKLVSSFKRVKHLTKDWRVVGAALAKSTKLQVNPQGTKLRRLNPLPAFDQTTPSRTILAARLPLERLSVESVAEIFKPCGEIALIRVLKPGHPAPAEVRQAISKRQELKPTEECAMIEFTDSASARLALEMNLGDAKIFELQQSDKKRKQQLTKKTIVTKLTKEDTYNSSSCASGSEAEDGKAKYKRAVHGYPIYHVYPGHPFQGPPSPDAWLSRRLSSCSISGSENGFVFRRLSSSSGSNCSDASNYGRRYSSCSSASETGCCPIIYPPGYYYQQNRRFSCCSGGSASSNECNGTCYNPSRRGSVDCGPFFRRLSTCSRDSGFDPGVRRLSLCSSISEQNNFCRSRNNNGLAMTHLPENVTRMPSGPDGTRGFGRPPRMNPITPTMEPAC
ncbi:la-related protein 6 isoform X1 [Vespa velutina]|uniref:la-related protein 6 isoform X1 n=1 Tax=Vespa velutina TaxID=202808 RepID=UPI001FB2C3B6|nr:la-related protein 6 isoform X1 [Vespa velutina]XP_047363537.1 la-related protein 6 isoform X1 [Vespa velutina]XP_047363538.1 la-related protein 6 isoform X1 [Vespa velutina]